MIRKRLPLSIHEEVFIKVLAIAHARKLIKGKSAVVDSTFIEAEATMKTIVRRDSGEDWKENLRQLSIESVGWPRFSRIEPGAMILSRPHPKQICVHQC